MEGNDSEGPREEVGGIGRRKVMAAGELGVVSMWVEPRPDFPVSGVRSFPPPGEATGRAAGGERQVRRSLLRRDGSQPGSEASIWSQISRRASSNLPLPHFEVPEPVLSVNRCEQ